MLLNDYTMDILQAAACKPGSRPLFARVFLSDDIGPVLPFANAVLGGAGYVADPPSLLLHLPERQIVLEPRRITISPVRDRDEALEVMAWVVARINEIWRQRQTIAPRENTARAATVVEVLRHLPRTNCGECGFATCMLFAARVVSRAVDETDCPPLSMEQRGKLAEYLGQCRR